MARYNKTLINIYLTLLLVLPVSNAAKADNPGLGHSYEITSRDNTAAPDYKAKLPDISGYNRAAVEHKQAKENQRGNGKISLQRMLGHKELKDFTAVNELRVTEWAKRQKRNPMVIVIEEGRATPNDIARSIKKPFFEAIKPGIYISRVPILIRANGSLSLGEETKALRLSEDSGAFIVNDGKLFIISSNVTAWREQSNTPAYFVKSKRFRPFIAAWGGSETYVVNATLTSLGYNKSKSYGFSLSSDSSDEINDPPVTAWLISSVFEDIYYGFYSYEAENVAIIKNVYRNNIVYGIDPHDFSSGLIIAENEVYGTKIKHGIIISREVDNSYIFGNRSYQNQLSGIVLDRHCKNNLVVENWVHDNKGDGIGLYESPNNIFIKNIVKGNERHGFRVRNSQNIYLDGNIILSNKMFGVYGQVSDLSQTKRDFEKDPYTPQTSFSIKRGSLAYNKSGPLYADTLQWLEIGELKIYQKSGKLLQINGFLNEQNNFLLDILYKQNKTAFIQPKNTL